MPLTLGSLGAGTIGDAIEVVGNGAATGGAVQSAVHESFTLSAVEVASELPSAPVLR